jgi:hypothetical protein
MRDRGLGMPEPTIEQGLFLRGDESGVRGECPSDPWFTGQLRRAAESKTRTEPREALARRGEDLHAYVLRGVLGFPAIGRGSAGLVSLHTEISW